MIRAWNKTLVDFRSSFFEVRSYPDVAQHEASEVGGCSDVAAYDTLSSRVAPVTGRRRRLRRYYYCLDRQTPSANRHN